MIDSAKYIDQILDGRYKIVREIGRGASSAVFYALDMMTLSQDERSPKPVAIKILDKDSGEYKLNSKSFLTEIHAVVNMPVNAHTVAVYDTSFTEREHYIVMEYVKGCTLRQYLNEHRPLPYREIISIALQVLHALSNAHEVGMVHRDVKPQNILLQRVPAGGMEGIDIPGGNEMPFAKLADFGIALLPDEDLHAMKNHGVGTLHYISPEQAKGAPVDARSDLYSLGVVMYEMATGEFPFDAESGTAIISKHQDEMPKHVCNINKEIPVGLDQIIYCAMRKQPGKRFRNANEMIRYLEDLLKNPTTRFTKLMDKGDEGLPEPRRRPEPRPVRVTTPKAPRAPMSDNAKKGLFIGAITVLVAAVITVGVILLTSTFSQKQIEVPNLVGEIYSEDMKLPEGVVLKVQHVNKDDVPKGEIYYQSEKAGDKHSVSKKKPLVINVVVSDGPKMVNVELPQSQRKNYDTAKYYLEHNYPGLVTVLGFVETEQRDPNIADGEVVGIINDVTGETIPMDGTGEVIESLGVVVKLIVNKPLATAAVRIPSNIVGDYQEVIEYLNNWRPAGDKIQVLAVYRFDNGSTAPLGTVVGLRIQGKSEIYGLDGDLVLTEFAEKYVLEVLVSNNTGV